MNDAQMRHNPRGPAQAGLDVLVTNGPTLEAVVGAIIEVAWLPRAAIRLPGDDATQFEIFDHPYWAVIHAYGSGNFAFKVDLDGRAPRDHVALARALAARLGVALVWPDETTLAPNAMILCLPDGAEQRVVVDDVDGDGDGLTLK